MKTPVQLTLFLTFYCHISIIASKTAWWRMWAGTGIYQYLDKEPKLTVYFTFYLQLLCCRRKERILL